MFVDRVEKGEMRVVGMIMGNMFDVGGNGIEKGGGVVGVWGVEEEGWGFIE